MSQREQRVQEYIQLVCEQIKCTEVHLEIEDELRSHIEEIVDDYRTDGMLEEEAVSKAIQQMGDPHSLGKQFHQRYKPRTEWSLVGMVLAFIAIGLITMYSIEIGKPKGVPEFYSLFINKTVAVTLGIAIALSFFYFDYRKLKGYSTYLYYATLLALSITVFFSGGKIITFINAKPMLNLGFMVIDIINLSPYLFVISLAGILSNWNSDSQKSYFRIISLFVVPILLYGKAFVISPIFIYISCSIVLLFSSQVNGRQKQIVFSLFALGSSFVLLYAIRDPYLFNRAVSFLTPYSDPLGSGYIYVQSKEAIFSAGLWGHGLFSTINTLPYPHAEYVLVYFIYAFGWLAGAILCGLVVLFIVRLFTVAGRLQDPFGSMITKGLMTIFSIKFLWTILMSFGLAPMIGLGFPFISDGRSEFILQMMAVGLILSIYRRKDLIRTYTTQT